MGQEGVGVWSAGLRRSGERELSSQEREEISRLSARSRLRGSALLCPTPFLFTLCLAGLASTGGGETGWTLLLVLVLALLLGTTPLLLLLARDWLREARALARDARSGTVDHFGGDLAETRPALQAALGTGGQAPYLENGVRWLEVLPHSGLVWRVNGCRSQTRQTAQRATAADPPPYAAIAAEWVEPADVLGAHGVLLGSRELSAVEEGELKGHLRALTFRPMLLSAALCAWLGLVLGLAFRTGHLPEGESLPQFLFLLVITGTALFSLGRSLRLGRKFRQDLRFGRVVIARSRVEPVEGAEETEEPPPPALIPRLTPPEEFLPASGALWTRAGKPAPWRLRA